MHCQFTFYQILWLTTGPYIYLSSSLGPDFNGNYLFIHFHRTSLKYVLHITDFILYHLPQLGSLQHSSWHSVYPSLLYPVVYSSSTS